MHWTHGTSEPKYMGMTAALPLATVIVSGVVYHLAQKGAAAANPWSMLAVAYAAALALTIPLAVATRDDASWPPSRTEWIAGLLVGLAAFGIEASTFFIYRAGWPLASASVIANIAITIALASIGVLVFGEHLTLARSAGLALAAGAALLIARG